MVRSMSDATLQREIDALADLPRTALVAHWRSCYRTDPPKGISRALLVRAVAYEMQTKASRGLKPAAKRRLRAAGDPGRDIEPRAPRQRMLTPGTRLVREWNGVTYRVEVVDGGYVWKGETFRSLSAIARTITGARWSGPRFFGLQQVSAS